MNGFAQFLSAVCTGGFAFGYCVAFAEWQAFVAVPFMLLYAYVVAFFLIAIATILLIGQAFRADFPLNRPDSLSKVVRYAPSWSKAVAAIGFGISILVPILFLGGPSQLSLEAWEVAAPATRACYFVAFAAPWFIALPGLKAVAARCAA